MSRQQARATSATGDPLRRLNPRIIDSDWLVMRGMSRAVSQIAARLARPGGAAITVSRKIAAP